MITERPVVAAPPAVHGPAAVSGRRQVGSILRAYVALTKPRIVELLLVTTVPAMMLADRGLPPLRLVAAVLQAFPGATIEAVRGKDKGTGDGDLAFDAGEPGETSDSEDL